MKKKIESESKFLWRLIWDIIKTPFIFILAIFGKRRFTEIFQPFKDIWEFITGAKFTFWIIILLCVTFIGSFFLPAGFGENLITYPSDILSIRVYTLITSGFLHANLAHLIGNVLALFIFGRVVEQKLGAGKTAIIYFGALLISGIFNSLVNLFYTGNDLGGLGASGAIMGLVSAAILLKPFYFTYEFIIPLPIMLLGWFYMYSDIIGIVSQVDDNIGHFAHLFGFLSIGLLTYLLNWQDRKAIKKGLLINILSLVIVVVIYYFVIA